MGAFQAFGVVQSVMVGPGPSGQIGTGKHVGERVRLNLFVSVLVSVQIGSARFAEPSPLA